MKQDLPEIDQEFIDNTIDLIEELKETLNEYIKDLKAGTLFEKIRTIMFMIIIQDSYHSLHKIETVLLNTGYNLDKILSGYDKNLEDIARIEKNPIFKRPKSNFEQFMEQMTNTQPQEPSKHNQELVAKLAQEIGVELP